MAEVTRHQKGNRRFYTVQGDPEVDGLELPNVTTLTNVLDKPALVGWAERVGIAAMREQVKETLTTRVIVHPTDEWLDNCAANAKGATRREVDVAADKGTSIHALIEEVIKGVLIPVIPPEYQQPIANFVLWYNNSNIATLEFSEVMVYSAKYRYAGTVDAVGRTKDGQLILLDWKTSNGLYKETALQLAAYCQAYCEMNGILHPDEVILTAVRIGKDRPEFETKTVTNFYSSLSGFLACMNIAEWNKSKPFV
tara:strand:- start:4428 stop:5186 length:759 start_codon:yes stop_codon:yes gene_type:complete